MKIEIINEEGTLNGKVLNNADFIYVSDGSWFIKGSFCRLEDDRSNCGVIGGIFRGPIVREDNKIHDDGELCPWDEFDIYDRESGNLLVRATREESKPNDESDKGAK